MCSTTVTERARSVVLPVSKDEDKGHPFIYIPFGSGAHKCLGLHFAQVQSKIFLFHLLRNFEVTKGEDMTHYRYTSVPLTFPTDGLSLTFNPLT